MAEKTGTKQAVTTPVADTERVLVEVPALVVDYYLMVITFPRRPRHIGTLEVWKKQAFAKELWKLEEKEELQLRLQAYSPKKKPDVIQKLHKNKIPVPEILKDMSSKEGLTKPAILLGVPCMNYDRHPAGASVDPKDPHDRYDVKDKSIFKIPTYDKSTFMYSGEEAYGLFPRLRLVQALAGNPDNLARVHCGREWRHSHSPSNLQNGHLILDSDGQWSELTATEGCIRVSLLAMRDIFEAFKPIANGSFKWDESRTDPKRGRLPYEVASAGTRKFDRVEPESPDSIGFVYCKEHEDKDWCFYSGVEAAVESQGNPPSNSKAHKLCDTAAWSADSFVRFHKATASTSTMVVMPEYP
jgi:hypothetical protein